MKHYRAYLKQRKNARRRLRQLVVRAYRKHGSVRDAASSLGMPRVTYHEWLTGKVKP